MKFKRIVFEHEGDFFELEESLVGWSVLFNGEKLGRVEEWIADGATFRLESKMYIPLVRSDSLRLRKDGKIILDLT